MKETPKRTASDLPTQFGSATAVSSSADNRRLDGTTPSQPGSDETIIWAPPSGSDQATVSVGRGTNQTGATTRAPEGGWGKTNPELGVGSILAGRYEILGVLGTGGMGSVYKAQDRELDRLVAIKVILPELARNSEIVDRFKQELRLSHKVTHRNVVRLYDLSEDAGMRFVTMELVAGRDLRSILQDRGKLPATEAADIFQQICIALEAAHGVGILHRDLKPQNVMLEDTGRVVVMDFGLARMIDSNDGMTQTGALIGTIDYMSPEQALGKELDQRSDIFAMGLIGYEMLTGAMPFRAESMVASLLKRTQQRAVPLVDVDKNIPTVLSKIVAKCLEKEPANRYQTAEEVDADLRVWQGKTGKGESASLAGRRMNLSWSHLLIAGVLILAIAAGSVWFVTNRQQSAKPGTHVPVSVLIADFENHTGDPVLDDTLEPMLGVAMEGASFINSYSRQDARRLAQKLPNPTQKLDGQSARLIAVSQGVSAVVTGEITLQGDKYNVSASATDAVTGRVLAKADVTAANKQEILSDLPKLAAPIRKALGDTTPPSVQFDTVSGGFTATSLDAVHQDALGVDEQFAGKFQEAFDSFQKAAELDPKFARAYAGMAAMAQNLGRPGDAVKYMKLAMEHVDRMTEREQYRDRGLYYLTTGNWQSCVQQYTELVTRYPADRVGQNNLATCYTQLRNAPKALEAARDAVEIVPKGVGQRLNLAFISAFAGDFAGSEKQARDALAISPSAAQAYLVLGEAEIGQGHIDKAGAAYRQLGTFGPLAASTASDGLADLAAYQGKYKDAASILSASAATDTAAKMVDNAARKYIALGNLEEIAGNRGAALSDTEKGLASSQSPQNQFLAANTYVDAGEFARANKLATSLSSALTSESQAYGKIIVGEIDLKRKDDKGAISEITAANNLLDTWIGHFELGRAYLEAEAFTEADSEFDQCVKRRGEAIELFMDNVPTYTYFPSVYYYQGRAREGMKSEGFKDFYQTYLSIRGTSSEDPLVPEIRHRIGQ